ncbi:MAG: phosphate ABC transporter permease PstA [Oscillospiraceae bacterium]|nr:phosphate ABC transporter permease PstA [Oscillospiraceae bacterium]
MTISKKESINFIPLKTRVRGYIKHPLSLVLLLLVIGAAVIVVGLVAILIGHLLIKGVPHIKPELFEWKYTTTNLSMMPAIINTLIITLLSLVIAVPIGIFSAIYLVEYAKKGSKLVAIIRITTETLSGIPSIVFGLFGLIVFTTMIFKGYSIIGGALTLSIMVLPIIIRTTEEALMSVPDLFREGSFGLGAGKLRTIVRIVLPYAVPGILAGVILSIGRMVGETAALIFTAGTIAGVPTSVNRFGHTVLDVTGSGRTLALHLFELVQNPQTPTDRYFNAAYATAVVLLVLVVGINALSSFIARRLISKV